MYVCFLLYKCDVDNLSRRVLSCTVNPNPVEYTVGDSRLYPYRGYDTPN